MLWYSLPTKRDRVDATTHVCTGNDTDDVFITTSLTMAIRMLEFISPKKEYCRYHLDGYHHAGILVFERYSANDPHRGVSVERYRSIRLLSKRFLTVITPHRDYELFHPLKTKLSLHESFVDRFEMPDTKKNIMLNSSTIASELPELFLNMYINDEVESPYVVVALLREEQSHRSLGRFKFLGGTYNPIRYERWNTIV